MKKLIIGISLILGLTTTVFAEDVTMTCPRTFFSSPPSENVLVKFKDNFFADKAMQRLSGQWQNICASETENCTVNPSNCINLEMMDVVVGDMSASCTFRYTSTTNKSWYVKQIFDFERKQLEVVTSKTLPVVKSSQMFNTLIPCS